MYKRVYYSRSSYFPIMPNQFLDPIVAYETLLYSILSLIITPLRCYVLHVSLSLMPTSTNIGSLSFVLKETFIKLGLRELMYSLSSSMTLYRTGIGYCNILGLFVLVPLKGYISLVIPFVLVLCPKGAFIANLAMLLMYSLPITSLSTLDLILNSRPLIVNVTLPTRTMLECNR